MGEFLSDVPSIPEIGVQVWYGKQGRRFSRRCLLFLPFFSNTNKTRRIDDLTIKAGRVSVTDEGLFIDGFNVIKSPRGNYKVPSRDAPGVILGGRSMASQVYCGQNVDSKEPCALKVRLSLFCCCFCVGISVFMY